VAIRGYGSSYTGRDPIWKKFVAALLILVILAALSVIYLQSHLVYDDNGVAHLELPWRQDGEEPPATSAPAAVTPPPDEPLTITVQDTDKSPTELRGVQLPALPLSLESWQAAQGTLPPAEEIDAVALTVKDDGGCVYYDSPTAKAVQDKKIVKAEEDTAAAIAALNEAYPYTIARLTCLQDPIVSRERLDEMGLKNTGGYVFYDLYSGTWLDPTKRETVEYIVSLAKECADLGFDEILLTGLTYPTAGKLDKIAYGETASDAAGRSQALCAIVSAVKDALVEEYPFAKVSVELPASVLTNGADETAGLILADMEAAAHRIYAEATPAEAPALAAKVSEGTWFVPELPENAAPGELKSYLLR